MGYSKCPSCDHEIYDRKSHACPFCGQTLGQGMTPGSPHGSVDQQAKVRIIILAALLLLALAGGLVAFMVSAKV